jgi:hypothetical protein
MREPFKSDKARNKDLGVIQALLMRMETFRMPRVLELKERVEQGETLTEHDMQFLKMVLREGEHARRLAARNPKYQGVVDDMSNLCQGIVQKALENEQKKGTK